MARSVNITTPMPTLEEFGKSKRRQDSVLRLVRRDSASGSFLNGRHKNSSKTSQAVRGKSDCGSHS